MWCCSQRRPEGISKGGVVMTAAMDMFVELVDAAGKESELWSTWNREEGVSRYTQESLGRTRHTTGAKRMVRGEREGESEQVME